MYVLYCIVLYTKNNFNFLFSVHKVYSLEKVCENRNCPNKLPAPNTYGNVLNCGKYFVDS